MKRVALLGATGSIGRQALEIVAAHRDLELVAASSGSQSLDGLAPHTQVGGDLTELLERAEPDVVLNAVVGFAGLPRASGEEDCCSPSTASTLRPSSASRAGGSTRSARSSLRPPEARSAAVRAPSSSR
jgi:aspartate-semialdehyde dehydrogenase